MLALPMAIWAIGHMASDVAKQKFSHAAMTYRFVLIKMLTLKILLKILSNHWG